MYITSILLLVTYAAATSDLPHPLSDEFIDLIHAKQNLWTAGRNFPEDTPIEHLYRLFGGDIDAVHNDLPIKTYGRPKPYLPVNFDPRDKWQNCPSLNEIRDQGGCGSSWAFGAVEAMTDRWCILSNGSQFHFSAQDVAGCSDSNNGCEGHSSLLAWDFWYMHGIVSGGNYGSNEGCKPYEIKPCTHNGVELNCSKNGVIKCDRKCQQGYSVEYNQDKRYGTVPYKMFGEDSIKAELYFNGPLEASFIACKDMWSYKDGVYKSIFSQDDCKNSHAVKMIGWGVENGVNYWLLANSWNTDWGKGGFMKFLRGENHMRIEDKVIGSLPKLN